MATWIVKLDIRKVSDSAWQHSMSELVAPRVGWSPVERCLAVRSIFRPTACPKGLPTHRTYSGRWSHPKHGMPTHRTCSV